MILMQHGSRIVRSSELRLDSVRSIVELPSIDQPEAKAQREARIRVLQKKYAKELAQRKPGKHGLL
uniref:Uncharacterized protein n=1 Tax=viral metagenome TaxID=1070528 RepID=A0A6M3LPV9_9ZZZZ